MRKFQIYRSKKETNPISSVTLADRPRGWTTVLVQFTDGREPLEYNTVREIINPKLLKNMEMIFEEISNTEERV